VGRPPDADGSIVAVTENKTARAGHAYARLVAELRRSNAASRHVVKARKGTRRARLQAALRDQGR